MARREITKEARLRRDNREALAAIGRLQADVDHYSRYQLIAELPATFEHDEEANVFQALLDHLVPRAAGVWSAWIYRVDHDHRLIELVANRGPLAPVESLHRLSFGRGTTVGGCVEQCQPRLVNDCSTEPGYPRKPAEPTEGALICVPVTLEARCDAAILYHCSEPGAFAPRDLDQLVILAKVAAHAISEIRALERAKWLYEHDDLTTLLNRRGFQSAAEGLGIPSRQCRALIFVDIDHFKRINSEYGYVRADQVLRETGLRLGRAVSHPGLVGRWGGEEFMALLPVPSDQWRDDVLQTFDRFKAGQTADPQVTVTAGATVWAEGEPLESAVNRLDEALRRGKDAGRDRLEFAT